MKNIHSVITVQQMPLLRLLLSLITGIIFQYCFFLPLYPFLIVGSLAIVVVAAFPLVSVKNQLIFRKIAGTALLMLFISIGGILSFEKNGTHDKEWIGNYYKPNLQVLVTIQEPLVTKAKSYKALARADAVLINNHWQSINGNVLLYFLKGIKSPNVTYGSQIIIRTQLSTIENERNPGSFDYKQFCLFNHIYYQSFLKANDYLLLSTKSTNLLGSSIIKARFKVLNILRRNFTNTITLSVAEALLIGYRDDLDKTLIQAYNNTGVIHIIIISGMRMGMIYGLLLYLFSPFKNKKWIRFVKPITIMIVLWGFCLIAGGAPTVSRSAIMFSVLLIGESINRRTNVFNNLSLSAMIILLINPFTLWDAGFQLSYAAVLGIVTFYQTIRNWFFFQNKILSFLWSLSSVTIGAQILTLPLILLHFHQLPTMFLFTNLLAVPFSCIILYAELLLLLFSPISFIASFLGKTVSWMLSIMNIYITNVNDLPFSVWPNIQVSILQVIFLYGFIIGIAGWLFFKNNRSFLVGLSFFLVFTVYRCIDILLKSNQQKLIVYDVPQHSAIDIIDGNNFLFEGDNMMTQESLLSEFYLKTARIFYRIKPSNGLPYISFCKNIITSKNKTILIINKSFSNIALYEGKIKIDVLIITQNPDVQISDLLAKFDCNLYVFDSSIPPKKVVSWVKDAAANHLQCVSVGERGAFEMNL